MPEGLHSFNRWHLEYEEKERERQGEFQMDTSLIWLHAFTQLCHSFSTYQSINQVAYVDFNEGSKCIILEVHLMPKLLF